MDSTEKGKSQLSDALLAPHPFSHHDSLGKGTIDNIGVEVQRNHLAAEYIHPSFLKVFGSLLAYLGIGTTFFYIFRSDIKGTQTNGIVDALYFCVVTMTTVGYGDLVPDANLTKLLACAFVFSGMALIALILKNAGDYLVEKQERFLYRKLHLSHKKNRSAAEIETNLVKYKCITTFAILLVLMAIGTVVQVFVEGKDLIDAFYCVCCTITTLGYGDESFSTEAGRIFAVFWILSSTVCLGLFFLYIAELHTESKQRELVESVVKEKVTHQDLELDEWMLIGLQSL